MLNVAFNNPLTRISDGSWNAALSQAAKWGGMLLPVAVGLCSVQIVIAAIARNNKRILQSVTFLVLAWPLNVMSLLLFAELARAFDFLTEHMLQTAFGGGGIGGFGLGPEPELQSRSVLRLLGRLSLALVARVSLSLLSS